MNRETLIDQFTINAHQLGLEIDVPMDGPINAELAVVGEGPGESEIGKGLPFVGGSGRLLFDTLRPLGLHRANTYVTNVVKRQISLSRKGNEKHTVYRDELEKWISMVRWELGQLPRLRTVFAMGNYALEALIGHGRITDWRGSVVKAEIGEGNQQREINVVITFNPAYCMRELKMEPMFVLDARKLTRVMNGTYKEQTIEAIINPSYQQAMKYIRDLKLAAKPTAWDIEVINMETACHGLTNASDHGMCINLRDPTGHRYTLQQEADILLALQDFFDSGVEIEAQNGQFDAYWVRMHDWLSATIHFDTLLAHHTLYPQFPHSLAFIGSTYTNVPYYKDEGKFWRDKTGDIDTFWRYNVKDVCVTHTAARLMRRELKDQGLDKFFHEHVMRAQPHLTAATVHGVAVDVKLRNAVAKEITDDCDEILEKFYTLVHELTGDPDYRPNPLSWQQLQALFFDRLKLGGGRGRSTDKENRKRLLSHPGNHASAKEMIVALNRYLEEYKFVSTFAAAKDKHGRWHCEYRQYGTTQAPGRLSSKQLMDGTGGNMQNIPVRARSFFVADPGMVFVYFDLGQAEARVVGWRADIEKWIEQFEQARKDGIYDAHRALASEMFKVPYNEVTKSDWDENNKPTIRYVAKRCRHGLNYRMEVDTLAEQTGLPYAQAQRAYALYHQINPQLRRWWDKTERDFRETRTMYNALGRRFKVIQRIDDNILKSLVAYYPQSTIGDKITQVWYQAEEDDEWPMDARIAIDVHDNLVALASPKTAKTALKVLKRHAESPIMIQSIFTGKFKPLIVPAETKMSSLALFDKKTKKPLPPDTMHRWSNMVEVHL